MNLLLIILLIAIAILSVLVFIFVLLRIKKEEKSPIIRRIEDIVVLLSQKIHNNLLQANELDNKLNELLYQKEAIKDDNSSELASIEQKIELVKKDVNSLVLKIEEMKEYKEELEKILKKKKVESEEKVEKFLSQIIEKIKYFY